MNNDNNNQPTLIKTPINPSQQPQQHTKDINPIQLEHQRNHELAETDDYDGLTFEVIENARVADKTIAQKGVYLIHPDLHTFQLDSYNLKHVNYYLHNYIFYYHPEFLSKLK